MRPTFVIVFLAMLTSTHAADEPMPVVKEPYHKSVFENEYVRIIDVQIPVGETTKYHLHEIASVVVYLTKSTNASQTWGETTTTPRQTTPGAVRYAPYDVTPLAHRVTNTGNNSFHVFDIELLRKPDTAAFPPPPGQVSVQWEQKLVRASNVFVRPGEAVIVNLPTCASLFVGIAGTTVTQAKEGPQRELKPTAYVFYPRNSSVLLRNRGTEKAEAVLLELK